MNIFRKIYCRIFQGAFRLVMPMMPYRNPEILESVLDIKNVLKEKEISKVLLVTDGGVRNLKLTESLEEDLKSNEIIVTVYDSVVPNPTVANCEEGRDIYVSNECQAIIAFGGGSVMDCAKGIGALVTNPKKTLQKMKGLLKVKNELPTLLAIPTTAGTGSETTITAVITDGLKKHKYTINSFKLIPHYAVLDASLTLGLPKHLTATTGMDALTHAVEAYIGNSTTKETRKYAQDATRKIMENLLKVYEDGSNERARNHMLKASYDAGLAFRQSYVGYVHAVAHSLGGQYGTPHGLANAVILPYVLSEYGSKIFKKLKELAVYSGVARPYDSDQIASNKFINKILEMNAQMEIPARFNFIDEEDIPALAKHASKEANPLYPVPVLMSAKELEKFYYKIKE